MPILEYRSGLMNFGRSNNFQDFTMADKNSKKSTPSSPVQRLSFTARMRISTARSLLRCARSFALWLAPELRADE
jgi:hypothetical protein